MANRLYLCYATILSLLASYCSAICCNNHNAACLFNSIECTPNCADGISLCDCAEACLNDDFGGCNTDHDCNQVITEYVTGYAGYPTSTETDYTTTVIDYYSTYISYNIVTQDSTYVETSTYVDTETSTTTVTVAGPTETVTARALKERRSAMVVKTITVKRVVCNMRAEPTDCPTNKPALLALFKHQPKKRDITTYITVTADGNYCGQFEGLPACVSTEYDAYTSSVVYTTSQDSTTYNIRTSTYVSTVVSYAYATRTVTADGYTYTVAADEPTPTTTSSSEPDVTVTSVGTDIATATASGGGGGGGSVTSDGNVIVTQRQTDVATATAAPASAGGAVKYGPDLVSRIVGSVAFVALQLLL